MCVIIKNIWNLQKGVYVSKWLDEAYENSEKSSQWDQHHLLGPNAYNLEIELPS